MKNIFKISFVSGCFFHYAFASMLDANVYGKYKLTYGIVNGITSEEADEEFEKNDRSFETCFTDMIVTDRSSEDIVELILNFDNRSKPKTRIFELKNYEKNTRVAGIMYGTIEYREERGEFRDNVFVMESRRRVSDPLGRGSQYEHSSDWSQWKSFGTYSFTESRVTFRDSLRTCIWQKATGL